MNKIIFLFFFILSLISCNSKDQKSIKNDTEIINIVDFEQKKSDTIQEPNYIAIFDDETGKNSTLTDEEISIVNSNLENAVINYNEELKIKIEKWNNEDRNTKWNIEDKKINLRYYFRQYIITKNKNGDKIVRVFCFCAYFGNWKNEIMTVHDGGDCYLNAKINLSKNRTEYFGTNGLA